MRLKRTMALKGRRTRWRFIGRTHRRFLIPSCQSIGTGRAFIVSQARGRTDIIIQSGRDYYLTSPGGELDGAVRNQRVSQLDPWAQLPLPTAQAPFQKEVSFWLNDVGKESARWPLELLQKPASD